MAGARQSKRVSWAPDVKLCQVRLFLSEDAPFQSGLGAQDSLQAKASWLLHATSTGADDSLPPGFEVPPAHKFKVNVSQIPLIKWKCPPRIVLNPEWRVVAGEESREENGEVALQNRRQLGVLEAIYPRQSSIPQNPIVSSEVQDSHYDDSLTPLIPMTAIEDEDTSEQQLEMSLPFDTSPWFQQPDIQKDMLAMGTPQLSMGFRSAVQLLEQAHQGAVPAASSAMNGARPAGGPVPSAEPDVMAAASAAFTAIMRSSEEGSMIDRDLLIRILSNPSLIEKLLADHGAPKQAPPPPAASLSNPPPLRPPPQINLGIPNHLPPPVASLPYSMPNLGPPPASRPHPLPGMPLPAIRPPMGAPPVKDVYYYKSLIQQHGEERQEALDLNPVQLGSRHDYQNNAMVMNGVELIRPGPKQKDMKPKIRKPCAYFNTPKGCRHGASCAYQHDAGAPQRIEQPKGTKRIKLDRGIAGRN